MNNDALTIFKNTEFGEVRTTIKDGDPWFVAIDICRVLDIANPRDAVSRLDDDEKNTVGITDGNRGNPNLNIVNESGVYSLIFTSRKPEAKAFKRWVTHDVLPTLRKQGYYSTMTDEVLLDVLAEKVHGNSGYISNYVSAALDKHWNERMAQCGALWDEHGLNWSFWDAKKPNYNRAFGHIWYDEGYGYDYDGLEASTRKVKQLINEAQRCKRGEEIPKWPKPGEVGYDTGRYPITRKKIEYMV